MSHRLAMVVGTRPNLVKAAALLAEIRATSAFEATVIHTGQHFDEALSGVFLRELGISDADVNLDVGSGSPVAQTARIMLALEPALEQIAPRCLVVVGDVTSTLAAALTAAKIGIPIAHVESGLRSFDRTMPEEVNRVLTDAISDFLFTSSPEAEDNLAREGVDRSKVHFVGNVMIDTLQRHRQTFEAMESWRGYGVRPREYALMTLHRPSNVDSEEALRRMVAIMEHVQSRLPTIFALHPRTAERLQQYGLMPSLTAMPNLRLTKPLGYLEFLALTMHARVVLTDSGGIQEETTALRVPCLTLRENTERPITISHGTNRLVGTDLSAVRGALAEALDRQSNEAAMPPLWDGQAAARVIATLGRVL